MGRMKHYRASDQTIEQFKSHVENGEYDCQKSGCTNTATQVVTVTQTFALFTNVLDVPVCDDHTDYRC